MGVSASTFLPPSHFLMKASVCLPGLTAALSILDSTTEPAQV